MKKQTCVEILDPLVVKSLQQKTPLERVAMIFEANRLMRLRLEGHFRSCHPEWDDQAVARAIAQRMSRGAI